MAKFRDQMIKPNGVFKKYEILTQAPNRLLKPKCSGVRPRCSGCLLAQFHSAKPELIFCAGSNPVYIQGVGEIEVMSISEMVLFGNKYSCSGPPAFKSGSCRLRLS